ncbi:dihydroneopterin aldolase [Arvimicrobium flavum]|uniref:amino acid kinase family protein n=1 Tax=Arvimicrobium flavum TaxID=3393320 RepID=UPI00237A4A2D|nr:dihydroneopterin aldolase [Mesorhizobium shangrilense]
MRRLVVKLGGSTATGPEFDAWITGLAASSVPLVIVPGGGSFADQVRNEQRQIGYSDAAAHAMAILAMDQFGHVILDRHARFVASRSLADMDRATAGERIPVWLPSSLALAQADIAASWRVTSDSLAAWLAGQVRADTLLLVKQTRRFEEEDDLHDLTARGIVDAAFAAMLPRGVELWLAGPDDAASAGTALASGTLPGLRLRAARMRRAG